MGLQCIHWTEQHAYQHGLISRIWSRTDQTMKKKFSLDVTPMEVLFKIFVAAYQHCSRKSCQGRQKTSFKPPKFFAHNKSFAFMLKEVFHIFCNKTHLMAHVCGQQSWIVIQHEKGFRTLAVLVLRNCSFLLECFSKLVKNRKWFVY